MSNSAHQREVNDLREAGLNPILSVNKGASTPSGNLAKMENALGAGVSSAVDTMNLTNQMKGTDSQVALQNAQSIAANADAAYKISSAKNTEVDTVMKQQDMPARKKEAELRKIEAGYNIKAAPIDAINRRLGESLRNANSAKDLISPSIKIKPPPEWSGEGKDGTRYHRKTGEILK